VDPVPPELVLALLHPPSRTIMALQPSTERALTEIISQEFMDPPSATLAIGGNSADEDSIQPDARIFGV